MFIQGNYFMLAVGCQLFGCINMVLTGEVVK